MLTGIKDLDLLILSQLDDISLFQFSKSNKYFSNLCETIWKKRFIDKYEEAYKYKLDERSWRSFYMSLFFGHTGFRYFSQSLYQLGKGGFKNIDLIKVLIDKTDCNINWIMFGAAKGGHLDLIEFIIVKGAKSFDTGMSYAALGGHQNLVDFFVEKGATNWLSGFRNACIGGHRKIVEFFISKGVTDWDSGLLSASLGGHRDLVDFFISKGSTDFPDAIHNAKCRNHNKLADHLDHKWRDYYFKPNLMFYIAIASLMFGVYINC